ncbi:MAG: glycosyltransferase family 2 protein [Pseudomonadota bacterium]
MSIPVSQTLPISAVIICSDPAPLLGECIQSLTAFDEVLVYLNGASENAAQTAARYANVTVVHGQFIGFGPTKQVACDAARNDWVFSIDSDERIEPSLLAALGEVNWQAADCCYEVLRQNYCLGKHIRRGGWGNDQLLRLFHRSAAAFNDKAVHEKVVPNSASRVAVLPGALRHDAVTEVDQFLHKISRYSELAANAKPSAAGAHPWLAIVRGRFAFFKSYVLQLGMLEGWRGVIIAQGRATGTFYRYAKRFANAQSSD